MLSWLLRYAPVAADLDPAVGVLDVGCGTLGLGSVFDGMRFAGQDSHFPGRVPTAMFAVRTARTRFPWADGAFDTVVCLDALERVAPDERDAFVAESARVAARRVLLAGRTDAGTDELLRATGVEPPIPTPHPLPSPGDLERSATVPGFTTTPWAQVNALLASLVMLGDLHPRFSAAAAAEFTGHREAWSHTLQAARFGHGPRRGFELARDAPLAPLVDPGRFDASAAAALECVHCGTRLRLEPAVGLRCVGCGRIPGRDATGSWDLS